MKREAHLLKFGDKTAFFFLFSKPTCFKHGGLSTRCILRKLFLKCQQNMCHKLVSCKWCTYTLMHFSPWHFLCFPGRPQLTEEGLGLTFSNETFSCARRVPVEAWISVYPIFCQPTFETTLLLDAVFIGFLWHSVMKGQRGFSSINCLSTVNKKFHVYFHSYVDANVSKTTRIDCCESVCSWPRKLKYFRITVNLTCEMFSENIRIL